MVIDYLDHIESTMDFPKEGVVFWDFTPLLGDHLVFQQVIEDMKNRMIDKGVTKIAAIESKGFIIGAALSNEMGLPMSLVRKKNLTPGRIMSRKFEKEYGVGEYQVKCNAFNEDDKVLIVYDILAGPGATEAAIRLVEESGAEVVGCSYIIELEYLKGREQLADYDLISLVKIQERLK